MKKFKFTAASAAVISDAVVLLCWDFVFRLCIVRQYFVFFLALKSSLAEEERAIFVTSIVVLIPHDCYCSVALPRGATRCLKLYR